MFFIVKVEVVSFTFIGCQTAQLAGVLAKRFLFSRVSRWLGGWLHVSLKERKEQKPTYCTFFFLFFFWDCLETFRGHCFKTKMLRSFSQTSNEGLIPLSGPQRWMASFFLSFFHLHFILLLRVIYRSCRRDTSLRSFVGETVFDVIWCRHVYFP